MNNKVFFEYLQSALFDGELSNSQMVGIQRYLDYWRDKHPTKPVTWLAYILSIFFHETKHAMQPMREWGSDAYLRYIYDIECSPDRASQLGNIKPGDGVTFAGRGDFKLTGRKNYVYQSEKHDLDLMANPDLMLDPTVSARVSIEGILDGDFTGVGLSTYTGGNVFKPSLADFNVVDACRVISNSTHIEGFVNHYQKFLIAIDLAQETITQTEHQPLEQALFSSPTTVLDKLPNSEEWLVKENAISLPSRKRSSFERFFYHFILK